MTIRRRIRSKEVLRVVFVGALIVFCAINVYRSTAVTTSSHEHFRREESHLEPAAPRATSDWLAAHIAQVKSQQKNNSISNKEDEDRVQRIRPVSSRDFPAYNVTVDGIVRSVPLWQRRLRQRVGNGTSSLGDRADVDVQYYLVELLQVRIYAEDKARWSVNELKQWMHYLFLAGVEHVYVCDHYTQDWERLEGRLQRYIDAGLLTYLPWGKIRDPMSAQIRCYQHIINRFRRQHRWQIAVDMDEYPFAPNDTAENFLVRYLEQIPAYISEISMDNFLMLGRGDRDRPLVIERIKRMTPQASNQLVKPIYRPDRVSANVHHNHLLSGRHMDAKPKELRMLHYWGARGQQWGDDTPKTIASTVEMTSMRDAWAEQVTNSLLVFGEYDALTNATGP